MRTDRDPERCEPKTFQGRANREANMQDSNAPQDGVQSLSSDGSDEPRSKFRLDMEIALLEAQLELKRLQSHRLMPLRVIDIDIDSITSPELSCNAELVALVAQADEIRQHIAVEFPYPATCHYDHPEQLQITIHYPDRPSVTIDILKSLRVDPSNIAQPQIAGAIAHYARTARTIGNQAELARKNLERVLRALMHKNRPREMERISAIATSMYLNNLPDDYFDSLWEILKSNEAMDLEANIMNDERKKRAWLNYVKAGIESKYPDVDHIKILAFLRRYPSSIPRHCGGNAAGAFKTAILSCKLNLEFDSVKTVRSANPFFRMSQNPLSETEWKKLVDDSIHTLRTDLTKMSVIQPYEDLSNLVFVKYDQS